MDNEPLLKQIQEWTNRVPLLVVGSGASVPHQLPTMRALGEYLKTHIKFGDSDDQQQFVEFKALLDQHGDLERALNELHLRPKVLTAIVNQTWSLIAERDLAAYDGFIVARAKFPLADLVRHLLLTAAKKVSIVTTNYDRLVEYAASLAGAYICTGYTQNYFGQFSGTAHLIKSGSLRGFSGQVNIWKVHGSLDWFKTNGDQNVHLPLRRSIPDDHSPSIVTPGLDKYYKTHTEPYRTIFAQADQEIEGATGYLCIGYGFNDMHVQPKIITQIKNQKPIIVITRTLTDNTKHSIIGSKNYVLIEQADNPSDTRIYSSEFGELRMPNTSYWQLDKFLTLIKPSYAST